MHRSRFFRVTQAPALHSLQLEFLHQTLVTVFTLQGELFPLAITHGLPVIIFEHLLSCCFVEIESPQGRGIEDQFVCNPFQLARMRFRLKR